MNNYVCEYVYENNEPREMCVRAYSKREAQSIVRSITRRFGYPVLLKNIKVLYINNERKAVNEKR